MVLFISSIFGKFVRSGITDFSIPASKPSRSEDWRLEIKFVLPLWAESSARLQLLNSNTGFRRSYPSRIVNNIYFDSLHKCRDHAELSLLSVQHCTLVNITGVQHWRHSASNLTLHMHLPTASHTRAPLPPTL